MNLGQFAKRIRDIGTQVPRRANAAVRKAAIAIDHALVLTTPVDTGRARSNWLASQGSPTGSEVMPTSAQAAIAAAEAAIGTSPPVGAGGPAEGDLTIFITNNVDYIEFLNQGSSAQAPAGFVEAAVQIGDRFLANARLVP